MASKLFNPVDPILVKIGTYCLRAFLRVCWGVDVVLLFNWTSAYDSYGVVYCVSVAGNGVAIGCVVCYSMRLVFSVRGFVSTKCLIEDFGLGFEIRLNLVVYVGCLLY